MDSLSFSVSPATLNQRRRLISREPPIARLAFGRQRYPYNASVEPLIGVVVDGRPKGFEVAARSTPVAAMLHVFAALMRVHFGEHLPAPKLVETADARVQIIELV